jgi:hypothetical protein
MHPNTDDSPHSGFPLIGHSSIFKAIFRDGRAVVHTKPNPDTEQVLKVTGFPGDGGCSLEGLSTVSRGRTIGVNYIAVVRQDIQYLGDGPWASIMAP